MRFFIGDKEERLARRLQSGENAALKDFYTLYADYLAGVCARYIADDEDLKDVFQDAMVNIISHIRDFHHTEFTPLDRDVADEVEEDEDPSISDLPPEVLHQMIRELPAGYRTVFNLYVFENKSHQEIAQLLGIKTGTSCSQFSRAKNLLAKKIKAYYQSKQPPR